MCTSNWLNRIGKPLFHTTSLLPKTKPECVIFMSFVCVWFIFRTRYYCLDPGLHCLYLAWFTFLKAILSFKFSFRGLPSLVIRFFSIGLSRFLMWAEVNRVKSAANFSPKSDAEPSRNGSKAKGVPLEHSFFPEQNNLSRMTEWC